MLAILKQDLRPNL